MRPLIENRHGKSSVYLLIAWFSLWNLGFFSNSVISQEIQTGTATVTYTSTTIPTSVDHITSTETETPINSPSPVDVVEIPVTEIVSPIKEATPSPAGAHSSNKSQEIKSVAIHWEHRAGEIIVKFKPKTSRKRIKGCLQEANAEFKYEMEDLGAWLVGVPVGKEGQSLSIFLSCKGLLYAEPNFLLNSLDTFPNDPGWGNQYGLINIRAPQGWDYSTGSSVVTIAILDSGVDLSHPDLAAKITPGYDFVNDDAIPQDDYGHGTHVAGIAAASGNNGTGISGVSWGARIMPVKVLNSGGGGFYSDVAQGIIWATNNGAQIINLSLGGFAYSATLQNAVDYAYSQGVTIVASSGNSGSNYVLYPARLPHVIAVGATDSSNTRAGLSNYGPQLDLVAPGVSIYSTNPGGYGYRNGTSMAAPFVSGLAAIIRGVAGYGSPDVIESVMESNALDLGPVGRDDLYGHGLIQMDAALFYVLPPTPTPATSNDSISKPFSNLPQFAPPTNTLFPAIPPLPGPTHTQDLSIQVPGQDRDLTPTPTESLLAEGEQEGEYDVMAQRAGIPLEELFLPCTGILLILLGILFVWFAFRSRHRRYYSLSFDKYL